MTDPNKHPHTFNAEARYVPQAIDLVGSSPETMEERFDEIFELESQGCSECMGFELIDKRETPYPRGSYNCEYDLDKVKSFIREEKERSRKEALDEAKKDVFRAKESIESREKPYDAYSLGMLDGIHLALDAIQLLESLRND